MDAKFQSFIDQTSTIQEFEGALISSSTIRPDEIILKIAGPKTAFIGITFLDGKQVELPLHMNSENLNRASLMIPEKIYREAEGDSELNAFLKGLFDNQRSLEVEVVIQEDQIVIHPIGTKVHGFKFSFVR